MKIEIDYILSLSVFQVYGCKENWSAWSLPVCLDIFKIVFGRRNKNRFLFFKIEMDAENMFDGILSELVTLPENV